MQSLERDKKIAWAAGTDEANRAMREAGKKGQPWTFEVYGLAVNEYTRIMDKLYPEERGQ